MNLARALDEEFIRVAKVEDISLNDLVEQVASITKISSRQLYHYRSGKQVLPSSLIPALCKRFRSRALLHALEAECCETEEEVPESFELTRLVAQTVRDTMGHYEKYLAAFEDGVISKQELDALVASGERVVQHISQFKAIASSDYERRQRFQRTR